MALSNIETSDHRSKDVITAKDDRSSSALFNSIMSAPEMKAGRSEPTKDKAEPTELAFTSIYPEQSIATATRGFKRNDGNQEAAQTEDKSSASTFKSFSIQGDLGKVDVFKPTVAFLDTGRTDPIKFDHYQLSHGQISELAASKNGYNTFILDIDKHPTANMSTRLAEVNESIKNGKLPLGKGDVLNISVGDNTMALSALNKDLTAGGEALAQFLQKQNPPLKLDLPVTSENLPENRQALLKSFEFMAPQNLQYAEALSTNRSLAAIERQGVTVLTAAGNNGPDRVDIYNLSVKNQLGSGDNKLNCNDSFSTVNGLTQRTDGAVGIYAKNDNGGHPSGDFIMANSGYRMEFNKADLANLDKNPSLTAAGKPDMVHLEFDNKDVPRTEAGISTIFKPLELPSGVVMPPALCGDNSNGRVALEIDKAPLILETVGTSFANIGWLKEHQQELQKQKEL